MEKLLLPKAPYTGSCHCGNVRYEIRLSLPRIKIDPENLPPFLIPKNDTEKAGLRKKMPRIYKCNCSTCQKMGYFHLRLMDSPNDFLILSPLDSQDLGNYRCNAGRHNWYFCKNCGIRCFTISGELEKTELDLAAWRSGLDLEGAKAKSDEPSQPFTEVLHVKAEGWIEKSGENYLSINAVTLDSDQPGLDLGEWTENGWIAYVDAKNRTGAERFGKPHEGGVY